MVRTSLPRKLNLPFLSMPGSSRELQGPLPARLGTLHYSSCHAVVSCADRIFRGAMQHGVRGAGLWRMKASGEHASSPQ
jgi:hypothetical protein